MYLLIRLPECGRLVAHPRWFRREYPRRPQIDTLQRARDDLEHRRRRAGELSVSLHPDRLIAFDLDTPSFSKLDLGQPAVRPAIQHRQAADPQPAVDIPNRDHVEPAVIRLGLGSHPHGPAKVRAVGDGDGSNAPLQDRALVQTKAHQRIAVPKQADDRGSQESHAPAAESWPAGGASHDLGTDASVRDVDEVAATR